MKILRWLIFAGLFFMPLLDGGIHIVGYRVLLFDLYSIVLFAIALIVLRKRKVFLLRTGWMAKFLVIFSLSWFMASIEAVHSEIALLGALRNLQLLFFALILTCSVSKIEDMRFYLFGMLGGSAWVSVIGWIQTFFGNEVFQLRTNLQVNSVHYFGAPGQYGIRTVTAFNDPIMSGQYLAVAFCMTLGWFLATKNRRERLLLSILIVLTLVPLLTSGSRSPILAGLFTALTLVFFFTTKKKQKILSFILIGIVVMLFGEDLFQSIVATGVFNVVLNRFSFGFQSSRWEYWVEILSMAKSYPFGVGIGNYVYLAPKYIPGYLLDIVVSGTSYVNTHAESMYLTQLIENGWLGFVAFLGIVTSATLYSWRLFVNLDNVESGIERSLQTAMFAAWMSISISMITTYGYNNIGIAMLFWFLVGLSMLSQYKMHLISVKKSVSSSSPTTFYARAT